MDSESMTILREAVRIRQRKETAERAVGRAARRLGKDFKAYVSAMSDLRDLAAKERVDVEVALGKLLREDE